LADWEQIVSYFSLLDRESDRVRVDTLGSSTEGRPFVMAIISSAANLSEIDAHKARLSRLADPRRFPSDSVEQIIEQARPAVLIGCAQHATEIGSTQMSLELAYRLAVTQEPELRQALDRVILLLMPSLNPDGHQMVTDWYREQVGGPYEGGRLPRLYHPYVGHDNNRDWFMMTQVETRLVSRVMYHEWFPQVVLDMHQMGGSGARLFVPPPADPVNPNYDPLLNRLIGLIGAELGLAHTRAGQTGVITHAIFDAWWPGYLNAVPYTHNAVSLISEAASCNLASPVFLRRSDLQGGRPGMDSYDILTNFPDPWPGGWWRLRDIIDYELVLAETLLKHMSGNSHLYLSLFHDLGKRQIDLGRTEPPYAFIIPAGQRDEGRAWEMARTLLMGGVEISIAEGPFTADEIEYGAGSLVIPMSQPFRSYAKDLLEIQRYPDRQLYPGGPPERPYDAAGWTLPLAMDVATVQVMAPFTFDGRPVTADDGPAAGIKGGRGEAYLIDGAVNNSYRLINRALGKGYRVWRSGDQPAIGGGEGFSGGFVVEPPGGEGGLQPWLEELEVTARGTRRSGTSPGARLRRIRLGVYQPWTASMDEGWLRWVLEKYEFHYSTLHNAEIQAGRLFERYDVIILPDISTADLETGVAEGELPSEYIGGLGRQGGFALRDFVHSGGVLVAVNRSSDWAIEWLNVPVNNILTETAGTQENDEEKEFFCPGSLLRLELTGEPGTGLLFGMGESLPILYHGGPVFKILTEAEGPDVDVDRAEVSMSGRYPGSNPLLSGWIQNSEVIERSGALADVSIGGKGGRVVLFGFSPYRRAQTNGSFRLLFNAIHLGSSN
jgi:hypothetical protein